MDVRIVEDFVRPEPPLTDRTGDYWRSGAGGKLRIARCQSCGHFSHPPLPVCPACHLRHLAPEEVSGRGTVYSWTLNRYQWTPGLVPPYVVAEVELAEQSQLLILSNVVECDPLEVSIGMPVQVCFARSGDTYIPLFRPADRPATAAGAQA